MEAKKDWPSVEISYRGLNYTVKLTQQEENRDVATFGDKVVDIILAPYNISKLFYNYFKGEESANIGPKIKEFKILDNIDGRIKAGSMTLILAPPGHGKSIFLKSLARLIPNNDFSGEILYQGKTPEQALKDGIHLGHLVQYVGISIFF